MVDYEADKAEIEAFTKSMKTQKEFKTKPVFSGNKNLYSNLIVMKGLPFTMQIRMVGEILSKPKDIDSLLNMSEDIQATYTYKEHSIFVRNINGTLYVLPGNGEQLGYDIIIDNIHDFQNIQHMAEFFSNGFVGLAIRKVVSLNSLTDYFVYESKNNYSKFYGYRTETDIVFTINLCLVLVMTCRALSNL